MWKQEETSLFLGSNYDVADELLLYDKKTMGCPKFLEGMFRYFHNKVIPNLLKLTNSPSLTKHKDLASLLKDGERAEAKNTPATRKKQLVIKDTGGSLKKGDLFWSRGIRCICSSTMNGWFHRLGLRYETRRKKTT